MAAGMKAHLLLSVRVRFWCQIYKMLLLIYSVWNRNERSFACFKCQLTWTHISASNVASGMKTRLLRVCEGQIYKTLSLACSVWNRNERKSFICFKCQLTCIYFCKQCGRLGKVHLFSFSTVSFKVWFMQSYFQYLQIWKKMRKKKWCLF